MEERFRFDNNKRNEWASERTENDDRKRRTRILPLRDSSSGWRIRFCWDGVSWRRGYFDISQNFSSNQRFKKPQKQQHEQRSRWHTPAEPIAIHDLFCLRVTFSSDSCVTQPSISVSMSSENLKWISFLTIDCSYGKQYHSKHSRLISFQQIWRWRRMLRLHSIVDRTTIFGDTNRQSRPRQISQQTIRYKSTHTTIARHVLQLLVESKENFFSQRRKKKKWKRNVNNPTWHTN